MGALFTNSSGSVNVGGIDVWLVHVGSDVRQGFRMASWI